MDPDDVINDSVITLNRLLMSPQGMACKALKVATLEEAQLLCRIIIYRLSTHEGPEARKHEAHFAARCKAITEELRRLQEE